MGRADRFPRLIVIGNGFVAGTVRRVLVELANSGRLDWLHLRDHQAPDPSFRSAAEWLQGHIQDASPSSMISVNTRIDLAQELGTGLHVGFRGPEPVSARARIGPDSILGYSIHQAGEINERLNEVVDYYLIGPVFDSISKPDSHGVGLRVVESAVSRTQKPVFAVGGITPKNVRSCIESGAYGVASIGGIINAPDATASLNEYLVALADLPP